MILNFVSQLNINLTTNPINSSKIKKNKINVIKEDHNNLLIFNLS